MDNDVKLLRAVNAFREQAYKAWDFLHSLVQYVGYGVDDMAILDVEGKSLPIEPSEFELSWLRVCEAMVLSDEPDTWHYKVGEVYRSVCGLDLGFNGYSPIPTAIQAQEAEERLEGLSTLSEVCLSLGRVAKQSDRMSLDAIRTLYKSEVERIRAKHKAREDEELYREVASELLEAQCTAGATLEQASAPEVAGLQAKIKELEQALEESKQALEASEAERAKLLNEFAENEASGPSEVIRRVLRAKGEQGVYRLCRVLDKAKDRGVITEVAGRLQWVKGIRNTQCAYMVATLDAEFYPEDNEVSWSDWGKLIGGIPARKLSNLKAQKKHHDTTIEGRDVIDGLFDD